ncbi:hypothetical protein KCP74_06295 [Salmonella enterica subsp. enterica]|nr:hypothetical protein KCP74_06295 [Salmonella enterica subsp. enterica]
MRETHAVDAHYRACVDYSAKRNSMSRKPPYELSPGTLGNMRRRQKQRCDPTICCCYSATARRLFKCWDNDKFRRLLMPCSRGYQVSLTKQPGRRRWPAWMLLHAAFVKTKPVTGLALKPLS